MAPITGGNNSIWVIKDVTKIGGRCSMVVLAAQGWWLVKTSSQKEQPSFHPTLKFCLEAWGSTVSSAIDLKGSWSTWRTSHRLKTSCYHAATFLTALARTDIPHQGLIFALLINLYNRTRWLQWPFCLCLTAFSFKTQNFWAKLLQNIVHQNTDLGNNWETKHFGCVSFATTDTKTSILRANSEYLSHCFWSNPNEAVLCSWLYFLYKVLSISFSSPSQVSPVTLSIWLTLMTGWLNPNQRDNAFDSLLIINRRLIILVYVKELI